MNSPACREVQEEVGLTLIDAHLREPTVAAEIAECVWVDPCHPTKPLAPLLEQAVFPALLS
ncbi:hypothetical protein [Corynebacterium diphtheriae]|uniref:hypothetical protein n=1 Tax=Corynebacterium diphtheriae TaxID=1717 RepID=UPI0013C5B0AA|nr:hypothetical protein [Corynebacterium diphtheriae]MBG9256075.1 hypothetical protein [Corynebacterium diphtheriae bv. mitis]CAB0622549.1 hypothetical protein CIP107536_02279 [Corynebacterium diphtheriae]CAB0627243.1 hypothetical protein CIP107582_00130 [Corynebacterium diphtheriae]CAB0826631.1 hypothetical protein FRC0285_02076 [Corynebacterium diphtheriae]CAB0865565.1 hypothetical protein FRC0306_02232 [Corynebacterium diphtheriae]